MAIETDRPRVNTRKAAEIAGVSERTIYNWRQLGRVEYLVTPTGGIRIYVDSLLHLAPDDRGALAR